MLWDNPLLTLEKTLWAGPRDVFEVGRTSRKAGLEWMFTAVVTAHL